MLAIFLGILPILTPPLCALAFIMCSKSNLLVVFALDLIFPYEGEHTNFGLLGQANLTHNNIKNANRSLVYCASTVSLFARQPDTFYPAL
jgi:hypothetical protein